VHADPGIHAARATLAPADLDRPTPNARRAGARWRPSVAVAAGRLGMSGFPLCKEDPVKPVLLLSLLACTSVLGCVALPPPLPPAGDPASDEAAEAPYPPPARSSAEPALAADAGMTTEPQRHRHQPGSDGGMP
jgi:hypothetical protein